VSYVEDVRADKRTKNVLIQVNTKTVSAPPESTGLTGDQLPDEVFTVSDFDQVKNQVNLEPDNFQLLDALNTMGQVTNMQSQSGPIVGTMAIKTCTVTGSGLFKTIHQPAAGEIWQVVAAAFDLQNSSGNVKNRIYLTDTNEYVIVENESASADGEFIITTSSNLFYSNNVFPQAWSQGTFDDVVWKVAVVRVR
tara:strand:- start:2601 stop:3182 length:582 start_codon:yes stop_codon:yes gene_type:complete